MSVKNVYDGKNLSYTLIIKCEIINPFIVIGWVVTLFRPKTI